MARRAAGWATAAIRSSTARQLALKDASVSLFHWWSELAIDREWVCLASDKCCSFFALLEKILLSSVSRDQIRSARARGACLNTRAINLLVLVARSR